MHEAGEILGDYPEDVRRTGRELHQVLQRCSHGREFPLVNHRCDRHLQHPAYVLAAEGLLGELHQQEFGPLVGGVLAPNPLQDVVRDSLALRSGCIGLDQRGEAPEDVPILHRMNLLHVTRSLLGVWEVAPNLGKLPGKSFRINLFRRLFCTLGLLRRFRLLSDREVLAHVALNLELGAEHVRKRPGGSLVHGAECLQPVRGPALHANLSGEKVGEDGFHDVVFDVRLVTSLQQKRWDPVKPQSLRGGRLRVGKPSDVDAVRGAEPLHHQPSHRVLLVDHSVANSLEELGFD